MKQNITKIYRKKAVKKCAAVLLIFSMLLMGFFPLPGIHNHASDISKAASNGNVLEREFDPLGAKFAATLNDQMERYLNGDTSSADRATVETDFTKAGLKATIRFHLGSAYEYPVEKDDDDAHIQIFRWLNQAVATYPSLCTLVVTKSLTINTSTFAFTSRMDTNNNRYLQDLTIYSPVAAGDIKSTTSAYKNALSTLTKTFTPNTLTNAEKVLLVHDRLVSTGDWNADSLLYHTAQSVLLEKKGACESYSYCFNHAMAMLGIDSLLLHSDEHAWNAVRLDNKWYYVDNTWDDPEGQPISHVGHDYLLVPPSRFADSHTMTADYSKTYSSVLRNIGNAYDNYFPKQIQDYNDTEEPISFYINRAMSYMNGLWYYSNRLGVYTWDSKSNERKLVTDIPSGFNYAEICSAVYNNELYYSTPEGIFRYRTGDTDSRLIEGDIAAMTLRDNTLYYTTMDGRSSSVLLDTPVKTPAPDRTAPPSGSEIPILRPTPTAAATTVPTASPVPTETPSATTSPDVEIVPPAKPVIKSIKNFAPRGLKVKVKSVPKAIGYQISYSINKNFKNAKKKSFTKTTFQVDKLKKKKTYYIRVRAYTVVEGTKYYGKWSQKYKIKIKK